jgi:predicted AlkP superfamily phosphohydrolase/phosphomutase
MFATGVSPATHGRYFFKQVFPGSYVASRFQGSDFGSRAFWDELSDAGRRVAVFDVPKVALSSPLNGVMSVDWIVHGAVYHELRTSPPDLASDLVERFGKDPLPKCDQPGMRTADENRAFLDIMIERVHQRTRCALEFVRAESWDLFLTVFGEPHCVGHQCWHVRDASHPLHDPVSAQAIGDPLREVYAAIDRAFAQIIAATDDDTVVIVFSGTGMGPNYTGNFILDDVLRNLEGKQATRTLDWFTRAKRQVKKIVPVSVRKRGRKLSKRIEESTREEDRARRLCFAVPHNDIAGAIRVNLVGREPEGKIHPGEEYDAFFESLRRDLMELKNLDTGGPVVADVVKTADFCQGPHLDRMPDFFVLWNRDAPIDRVGSPRAGEVEYVHRGNRTGDHTPESLFIAAGPGVRPGSVGSCSILDLAPTVAEITGVHLAEAEGHPLAALLAEDDR